MDKNKNNIIEEVFRSKLHDYEMDTNPNGWEAISKQLDKEKSSVHIIRRYWHYWAIAAVVALLVTIGGFYQFGPQNTPEITQIIEIEADTEKELIQETPQNNNIAEHIVSSPAIKKVYRMLSAKSTDKGTTITEVIENSSSSDKNDIVVKEQESDISIVSSKAIKEDDLIAENYSEASPKKQKARKWGFGMGGGGLTTGSESVVNSLMFKNTYMQDDKMMVINSITNEAIGEGSLRANELKTNINHKTPISFGLSVNRYLNNRFSLQTGLTYSMLNSEWEQNGVYHSKTKQRLHLIGVPLAVTYKIAEWERFNFYGSAGILGEINVAGELQTKTFSEDKLMDADKENIRMKEPLFSVSSRVGISYPLIKFVSAFTEVGASYYFDNGSKIETIHSEKPFNVSLQVGVRFGF